MITIEPQTIQLTAGTDWPHGWRSRLLNATFRLNRQLAAQQLSRQAKRLALGWVQALGYRASLTAHQTPFDMWVQDGDRAIRVKVGISLYKSNRASGRYQYDVRHHDQIDLLIFIARNGRDWPFIIPMTAIAPRRNIAIWSACPEDYNGQWAPYLNDWEQLTRAIAQAGIRLLQPPLFC